MRFLHLGDLHLGRSLGEYDLIDDQRYILNRIIDITKEKDVDAVLIAGDVYDRSVPSEAATVLLDKFLTGLSDRGVSVFMISGNHDSDERLGYGRALFSSRDIYISSVFDGKLFCHKITDGVTDINIYMLPFVKASTVSHCFPDAKIDTYEDAVGAVIASADIDPDAVNILIAHQFVASGQDPHLAGSESVGTISVGLVEKIGYRLFDDFDYVALGHIHSPQKVGRDTVRYSGSPLKYSLGEVNNEKSFPLITVSGKGDIDIELIPASPLRDLRHIRGKMKDLLDPASVECTDDFIYATLTDEDTINDAMLIFRQTYPNTVRIDYDNSHTKELEKTDVSNIAAGRSFTELIREFYTVVYGCEMSDEEMDVVRDAAYEAGVNDETG